MKRKNKQLDITMQKIDLKSIAGKDIQRWELRISIDKKVFSLGIYDTAQDVLTSFLVATGKYTKLFFK